MSRPQGRFYVFRELSMVEEYGNELEMGDQEQMRLAKLRAMREMGIDPYPPRAQRTHRRSVPACAEVSSSVEGSAPPARQVPRPLRRRDALPPAIPRPDRQRGVEGGLQGALPADYAYTELPGCARLHGGRDARLAG